MSAPTDDTTLIEWVVAGVVAIGGLVAAVGKRAKRWVTSDEPVWVERLIEAMHEVGEIVQRANASTTDNIRNVLTLYGKDVSAIRDAQQRTEDKLEQLSKDLTSFRLEEAKRK